MKTNVKKHQKIGKIMEINVNSTRPAEVLTRVRDLISHNVKFYIVTPNPELVLMAQKNQKLKNALNSADLSIPDGSGLKLADPKLQIIKGREMFLDLIKLSAQKGWKVFLLGGLGDEASIAKLKIENSMKIESDPGPRLNSDAKPLTQKDAQIEKQVIGKINKFAPELLFIAFGNPKQEIWIYEHLSMLKIGGAMCVGGTLRYIAGLSKLPPKWMADADLEWLWRVLTEPKRIGRVFKATIVFPLKVFFLRIAKR